MKTETKSKVSPDLNRQLHFLLNQAGRKEFKAELVQSYTNGRTTSSSEMTNQEVISLIHYLKQEVHRQKVSSDESTKNNIRRYIISLWYRIENAQSQHEKKVALTICMDWVKKHFKGDLNDFSSQDLYKIKLAAENVLKDRAKAVRTAISKSN